MSTAVKIVWTKNVMCHECWQTSIDVPFVQDVAEISFVKLSEAQEHLLSMLGHPISYASILTNNI